MNLKILLLSVLLVVTTRVCCFSCQTDLVDYLESDVAAVAVISNPKKISDYILELKAFDSVQWTHAWELAVDDEFGFVEQERVDEVKALLLEAADVLSRIDEIGVVLHDIQSWDVSIVMKAKPNVRADLNVWFTKLTNHVMNADKPISKDGEDDQASAPTKSFVESESDWLIVSSSTQRGAEIVDRISSNKKSRSLSQSRKYQRVKSLLSSIRKNNCPITVYGSPEKLSGLFFPDLSPEELKAYQLDEIPSFGFQIDFCSSSDKFQPSILLDAVATFTQPHSGIIKVIDAYKPLGSLPNISLAVTNLTASAFEPLEKHSAFREIKDTANGDGSYELQMQKGVELFEFDYEDVELAKSKSEIKFSYVLVPQGQYASMTVEGVRDSDAAQQYIEGLVKTAKISTGSTVFRKKINDFGELFSSARNSSRKTFDGEADEQKHFLKLHRKTALFLNEDWLIRGRHQGMLDFLESARDNGPRCDAQKAIATMVGKEKSFFVGFGSIWMLRPAQFEDDRIMTKYKSDRFKAFDVKLGKYNEFGYRLKIESKEDSIAVFKSLIANAFGNDVGSYAFSCSKDGEKMWLKGGMFPEIEHPMLGVADNSSDEK